MTDLVVITDTREQRPLRFSDKVQVFRKKLEVGDYSLMGAEDQVAIERKSLSDLLGTITEGRKLFIKELRQFRSFKYAAIVVESSWQVILSGIYGVPSQTHPNSVIGSLMSFSIKYGVQIIMAEDHDVAGRLVESLLWNYWRILDKEHRAIAEAKVPVEAEP